MPELPDIEVIKEFLAANIVGQTVVSVDHVGPIVVRNLLLGDAVSVLGGRRLEGVQRRGRFLLLDLDRGTRIAINFMLSGRLMYCAPATGRGPRTFLVLSLSGGRQLRYTDQTQMGKLYLTDDLGKVPTFGDQGPDALDLGITLDVFRQRMHRHPGEVKGTLTNQAFVAGIGNAYADEISFDARIYPFRRRSDLSSDDIARLYASMQRVLRDAIVVLRGRVGSSIHEEIRDFLQVHGKGGQSCPRCGAPISQVAAQQRTTNFCRSCQPGTLVRQT